jgi:hypothetical protein
MKRCDVVSSVSLKPMNPECRTLHQKPIVCSRVLTL